MLYIAFFLGLVSSLHCIGMCGPIAMMVPVDRNNPAKKVIQILIYQTGRIAAYVLLGLFFGLIGKGFYIAGMQQQLSVIVGLLMIVIAIVPEKKLANYNFSKPIYRIISTVKSNLGTQFKKKSFDAIFTLGLFNGFLPCPMVYTAVFGALSMDTLNLSMVYMAFFGIGTIPLMSLVIYISNFISQSIRNKIQKFIPIFIFVIGCLFVMRGLGLKIPYISPGTTELRVQESPACN